MKSVGMSIGTESEIVSVGAMYGEQVFYDQQSIDKLNQYLYGIGGGKMPRAIGYVPSGVSGGDAYQSMLDYVGGYVSDTTRLGIYASATSVPSGQFNYSDAGVVDLTRGLGESLDYIDTHLVSNGYTSQAAVDAYDKAVASNDQGMLSVFEDYHYEGVGRGRLKAYFKDDLAPARFRDSARVAGSHPNRDMLFDYVGDFLPAIPFEKALAIPGKIAAKAAVSADRLIAGASRLVTAFRRARAVEGELLVYENTINRGTNATKAQMAEFMAEAERLNYKVEWLQPGFTASTRRGLVKLRPGVTRTGKVLEKQAPLSTLLRRVFAHVE